jgi:hypothetical protein
MGTSPKLVTVSLAYQEPGKDGVLRAYSGNIIAENMYARCHRLGNQYRLMDELIDHQTDGRAIRVADSQLSGGANIGGKQSLPSGPSVFSGKW